MQSAKDDGGEESSSLSSGTEKKHILASLEAILLYSELHGVKNGVTFKEYRKFCMAKKQQLYRLPTIIKNKAGDWYIQYYYRDPKTLKFKPFKERCGINYIKDLELRQKEANELCAQIAAWLTLGNSPFDGEFIANDIIGEMEKQAKKVKEKPVQWTLAQAIAEYRSFIDQKGYAATTIRTYRKYVKAFENWLKENKYLDHVAAAFTEMEVEVFLNDYYDEEVWSGRTFNNYLEFMITFFARIKTLEKKKTKNRDLKYEFDPEELEPKITKPQRNKSFTPLMIHLLKDELRKGKEATANLRDYLEWLFLSLMRPTEVRELKVADIDDQSRQIRIIGKTGDRLIPISDQLMRLIHKRGLFGKSLNSFVFGYAGNVDERRMSVAYFLDKFASIKLKMGLDANYGPYSMKPTGVINMINAGFTDAEIMGLTGHKTEEAFRAYKRDLVVENTNVMKGSVIEF